MTWAEPTWLWALGGVVALAVLVVFTARRHQTRLAGLFRGELLERVLPSKVRWRRALRDGLLVLGLAGLVLALAEPRFGKRLVDVEAEGVDLVILLDLSRSMDAQDVDPSRLERARREILDLADRFTGDRVGLVMYAGGAYARMPLTLDYRALELIVRELDTHMFQAQGSALDEAIREGLALLDNQQGEAGQAMLVVSDGEVHDPSDAYEAAREAADAGVPVFGLVVGGDGARVPTGNGSFVEDPATGEVVVSVPDTTVLAEIARITGGAVVRSVASSMDVDSLYAGEIRPAVAAATTRTQRRESWQSAVGAPLTAGVLLLLLAGWIGDGRQTLVLVALLAVGVGAHAQEGTTVRDGDLAYRSGEYGEAVRIFTDLALERPDDPELLQRLGAARYRAGDPNGAARAFERQAELTDDPDASYNAGNAYWRGGKLDRAIERYEDVLRTDPDHPGASQNLPMLKQELQQRRVAQPPPQQPQDQDQDGEGESAQQESGEGEDSQQGSAGEAGEQPQDPEGQGDPQDQDGQGDRAPEQDAPEGPEGEVDDGRAQAGDGQGDPQPPTDGGTRSDAENTEDGTTSLEDIQDGESTDGEAEGNATGEGEGGEPTDQEAVSAQQAERVLDGVEEGKPRVYIPGRRGDKPW